MNINIDEIITELTYLHVQLNEILFSSKLQPTKIAIETSKHRRIAAWAYFEPSSGWDSKMPQITFLTSRWKGDYIEIISTLVHEMCHQYNYENKIKDVEISNGRHNKNFKKAAIELGLLIVKNSGSTQGLNQTTASQELIYIVETKLDFNRKALSIIHSDSLFNDKTKQFNYKYECSCGKTLTIRKKMDINCNNCNTKFLLKSV